MDSLHESAHRGSGTFRLRIEDNSTTTEMVLRVPVPGWIGANMLATGARALQLADEHGLDAPRLIASDLDGEHTGQPATLETLLPGSSEPPERVSQARLEAAGAAIAKIHAVPLTPAHHLPYRPRPIAVDDFAGDRRAGQMPTTELLQEADKQLRAMGTPAQESVFVHGDVWGGNMLWDGDVCLALIDWKTAGAGDPGVDLGELRKQMALQYGPDAPAHVLNGWQRQAGRNAVNVAYWDAVAALNTPTELDTAEVTARRDAFLQTALDHMPT
ncbi:phosphotransferase [Actinopolymorpha rutila]|uniref:Aminoglycoside phosphotransferase (APT) family kinase protein n=1 Tax=Actinopolymorpha rutila TaxID=446787 RepID=A0A852ZMS8_9ACTN|nr:aminoglycoside phosphotransferase (APT) family kinase protein [Actinopolymorpha rutila]